MSAGKAAQPVLSIPIAEAGELQPNRPFIFAPKLEAEVPSDIYIYDLVLLLSRYFKLALEAGVAMAASFQCLHEALVTATAPSRLGYDTIPV